MTNDDISNHRGKQIEVENNLLTRISSSLTEMQSDVSAIESTSAASSTAKDKSSTIDCNECDLKFSNHKSLKQHQKVVHFIGNFITCNCGFVFFKMDNYNTHIKIINKPNSAEKLAKLIKTLKKVNNCPGYQWKHDKYISAPKPANSEIIKAYISHYEGYLRNNFKVLNKIQQELF